MSNHYRIAWRELVYTVVNEENRAQEKLIRSLLKRKALYSYQNLLDPSTKPSDPLCIPAVRLRVFQLELVRKVLQGDLQKARHMLHSSLCNCPFPSS